jgi:hypothetical protein
MNQKILHKTKYKKMKRDINIYHTITNQKESSRDP